jgi:formylglycine-generating enzyme required for sulfatase activity
VVLLIAIYFLEGGGIQGKKQVFPSPEPTSSVAPSPPPDPFEPKPAAPEGMIYIPGGTFQMGYDITARDFQSGPPHQMTVNPFFIDKYEVTIEAYLKSQNPTVQTEENRLPMTGVTWREADSYCSSMGKRLPTEEEWEFAARGTDGRIYPWGNSFEPDRANVANEAGSFFPVGSFPSGDSPFGVSDMSGNAMEWTDSDFRIYDGSVYKPAGCSGTCKVIRGGAYFDQPQDATAVFRKEYEPSVLSRRRNAYAVLGFRCAKEITR